MAHTILQLMEKANMSRGDVNLAIEYIKDALWEIQREGDVDTYKEANSIVADQRYYGLPSDCVNVKIVYGYNSDEAKYYPIPRALDRFIPDTDEDIGSGTSGDSDNYLIIWG